MFINIFKGHHRGINKIQIKKFEELNPWLSCRKSRTTILKLTDQNSAFLVSPQPVCWAAICRVRLIG